jgi:hypothetical protein
MSHEIQHATARGGNGQIGSPKGASVILGGVFYLSLLAIARGYRLGSDPDASRRQPRAMIAFALGMHVLAFLVLSIPGFVLLYAARGVSTAILTLAVFLGGFALFAATVRRVRHEHRTARWRVFRAAEVLLVVYVLQLGAAATLRLVPHEVKADDGKAAVLKWKGMSRDFNVFPILGIWPMADPEAYYIEVRTLEGEIEYVSVSGP